MDLYRVVQAEIEGLKIGAPFGNIRGFATLPSPRLQKSKSVVIVPVASIDPSIIQDLQQQKYGIEAVLLLLPRGYDKDALSDDEENSIRLLQTALLTSRIQIPIFATITNDQLEATVDDIRIALAGGKTPSAANGGFEMFLKGDYPKDILSHKVINFAGTLQAAQVASGLETRAPTIIITAYYDSAAAIPSLAFGADSNGSGVVVLLQLMRIFRRLYHSASSRGAYNLIFLVTGGGHLNFEGVHQWLNEVDASLLENVEFALCLDAVGTAATNGLHLHYSKPPKDESVSKFYDAISLGGKTAGVSVSQVHKKVNVGSPQLAWEHEQFSKRRILAATLSAYASPPPPEVRASILDTKRGVNLTSLHLTTKAVGEALAHLVYPDAPEVMQLVNLESRGEAIEAFASHWLDLLSSHTRMVPFYSGLHTINAALLQFFKDHSDQPSQHVWVVDPARFKFANNTVATLTVSKQHSFVVDGVILLANMVYLALLFTSLRVATRGWRDFLAIFKSAPKKHKRS